MPVTNPDGRDATAGGTRTTAYGFDPNRDFASRNQDVNATRVTDGIIPYPGPVYIDAHQQTSGYFFPPNEDPVLHEMSDFTIQTIQDRIGPALQERFNDQSAQYRNYNAYDLFAIEYGDSVPSLQLGAAGMTYEKGTSENYGKQVYDHYLAMDETMNVISDDKDEIMAEWSEQWEEARLEGENGELEPNELVSPLTPTIIQEPNTEVFGYYYLPNNHSGDTAKLIREMRETEVHVYRLDEAVSVPNAHNFADGYVSQSGSVAGEPVVSSVNLPAGTLFIPMDQTQKHWIQGILGEDPFIPVPYFYDVVDWSFSQMRGMSGNGYTMQALPEGTDMTEVTEADYGGVTDGAKPVLAFPTDSAQGIAMLVEVLSQGCDGRTLRDRVHRGRQELPDGHGARRRLDRHGDRHGRSFRAAPGPGHRARRLSGQPQGAREAEDRLVHRRGNRSDQPAGLRRSRRRPLRYDRTDCVLRGAAFTRGEPRAAVPGREPGALPRDADPAPGWRPCHG